MQAPEPAPQPLAAGYGTYVHGTKLTIVCNPSAGVRQQIIFGESTGAARFVFAFFSAEDRITGAVGVGGARAVNQLRSATERRSPSTELELENRHESAGRAQ
ncbi:hypothetical protein [Arthrobacter sp. H5]|uniref:hypothetical protein n=1 Tax=Arthrobacter sp. H5 TaxID=1267973 RepID=UPI00047FE842|nr:hypothetical protein [Arthrobacter sp. H5]